MVTEDIIEDVEVSAAEVLDVAASDVAVFPATEDSGTVVSTEVAEAEASVVVVEEAVSKKEY